jgi:hypothetical protein
MCRRATSANCAAVNRPKHAVNSWLGRVHGAVSSRFVCSPACAVAISTVEHCPDAIARAASSSAGMPVSALPVQTGRPPSHIAVSREGQARAEDVQWMPSTSARVSPAERSAPRIASSNSSISVIPTRRACFVL